MNDSRIPIFLDNNVWDFLFERRDSICLSRELPATEFDLAIVREIEFEMPPMPDNKRRFACEQIRGAKVRTRWFFGFVDPKIPPDKQRIGGWDKGEWASPAQRDFMQSQQHRIGRQRPTGLYANEADIALAARSLCAIVLTNNSEAIFNDAEKQGGTIVHLNCFDEVGVSLRSFIERAATQWFS
ncbi:hypothetical protein [Salinisphaera hydrothermalis]|uniref:hypothetical protein n=1 Tax=Salinisphaera hydrothermalis TaxID=563188 RepID=UPI00334098D2